CGGGPLPLLPNRRTRLPQVQRSHSPEYPRAVSAPDPLGVLGAPPLGRLLGQLGGLPLEERLALGELGRGQPLIPSRPTARRGWRVRCWPPGGRDDRAVGLLLGIVAAPPVVVLGFARTRMRLFRFFF